MTLDPGFTTPRLEALFTPESRLAAMCRFEAALATASARAGLIPDVVGEEIAQVCGALPTDAVEVLRQGWEAGTPVVPLLERLRARLSPAAASALHHGATTQDVVDTALMLLVHQAMGDMDRGLTDVAAGLADMARAHAATPTAGRTFLQHAKPITFGFRVAGWLEPVVASVRSVRGVAGDLPLQLGGPVGTNSDLGDAAGRVIDGMAGILGLAPSPPWHTDRRPIVETVAAAASAARAMAKIAGDVAVLTQPEIGEVQVRTGGSSSMPGKRNPVDVMRALAAWQVCVTTATGVLSGPPPLLERGGGAWHAEWFAVPVTVQACGAAIEAVGRIVASLEADTGRMLTNLGAVTVDQATVSACRAAAERAAARAEALVSGA